MNRQFPPQRGPMGKMVETLRGWQVWPTPYWYHIDGLMFFAWARFKGARLKHNRRARPVSRHESAGKTE